MTDCTIAYRPMIDTASLSTLRVRSKASSGICDQLPIPYILPYVRHHVCISWLKTMYWMRKSFIRNSRYVVSTAALYSEVRVSPIGLVSGDYEIFLDSYQFLKVSHRIILNKTVCRGTTIRPGFFCEKSVKLFKSLKVGEDQCQTRTGHTAVYVTYCFSLQKETVSN
jgi:hypothetical protein